MSLRAVRDGHLMLHQDIPVFRRRPHDGQADLQRALLFCCSLVSRPGSDVLPGLDAALQPWGIGTAGAWLEQL